MSEEILINVTPQETRVAVVENGILQEIYVERSQKLGLVGSIFKGSVSRVLPGMQAAFIDPRRRALCRPLRCPECNPDCAGLPPCLC